MFVSFSMLLKAMHIFSMCLFWRLVKARDFEIKYMQEPGLNIRKKLFIEFQKVFWSETITKTEKNLLKPLYICICERLFSIKEKSCVELRFFFFEKGHESEDLKEYTPAFIVCLMFLQWGFFSFRQLSVVSISKKRFLHKNNFHTWIHPSKDFHKNMLEAWKFIKCRHSHRWFDNNLQKVSRKNILENAIGQKHSILALMIRLSWDN